MKTTKADTTAKPNCFFRVKPIINRFSWVSVLLLLTGVTFLAILPNAWAEDNGVVAVGDKQPEDIALPKVAQLTFDSTGPYRVGDTITVYLRMSEHVIVTGTPTITIVIGTTEKTATYTRGQETDILLFEYTAAQGDGDDTNGISVKANSLSLNGGTIEATNTGNAAILKHDAVADGGDSQRVDTTAPTVSSIDFSSTGPYKSGSDINVTVTTSENVTVTGFPTLTLVIGTTARKAEYTGGSGTTQLAFKYPVALGDGDDTDGVSVKANALNLNGGTIKDAIGNAATLTHNGLNAGNNQWVDATAPTVSSIDFSSTGPYKVGDTINVTLTTNENVTVTGIPKLTFVIGTTDKTANYTGGSGTTQLAFQYIVAQGDGDDTNGVSVKANSLRDGTIEDSIGNAATLKHDALADGGDSQKVDTTPPQLAALNFSTTGPYKVGDLIKIHWAMSEHVIVTGTPTIKLVIGTTEKTANYTRDQNTNILLFDYTVAAGDTDTDGISVKANSLSGTITDLIGNAVTLTHSGLADGGDPQRVDTTPPQVNSLAFTSTGPYKAGDTIAVTLTMSENVKVTGTPTLTLVVGTTDKTANYTSGTGTTQLVFQYTVATGDGDDTDGVAVKANSLSGGTIKDESENPLNRTHAAVADAGNSHRVDTTAPTVSSLDFSSTGPYKAGDSIAVTLTMSENVKVTGTPTLTLVVGTADKTAKYTSVPLTNLLPAPYTNTLLFRYTVADGDGEDTDGVSVKANTLNLKGGTIKDAIGNAATLTHNALANGGNSQRVDATAPTVSSLAFSSTGPYKAGDSIDVTVTMSENVTVTGTPTIKVVIGTTEKTANYTSTGGTGLLPIPYTNTLLFRYTVADGDGDDTDGVAVKENSLSGTLKDSIGNAATLTHNGLDGGNSQQVDTTPPQLASSANSLTFLRKGPHLRDGPHSIGDIIEVFWTMSENVILTGGTPTITLVIGTTEKPANYTRLHNQKDDTLVFQYTVVAGDTDTDGVAVKANSLNLNGGTLKDSVGNAAILTHSALDGGNNQRVDTTIPTVSSVAFTSTGPYKVGDNIDVTVTTSENVTVTGMPTLTIVIGNAEKTASYHSGSRTSALVFRYPVVAGDTDTDGVSVKANSLNLNGGTIQDDSANPLNRTHAAVADAGNSHRVDTTAPTVSSLAFTSIGPYSTENVIEVTMTMSETVIVTGTPQLTIVIDKVDLAGTKTPHNKKARYASGSGSNTLTFRYTVANGDGPDKDGVAVKADSLSFNGGTIKDSVGNAATLTHAAVANAGVGHRVDTALLQVSTVDFTSTGPYGVGSNIEVTVKTTKPVTVTGGVTLQIVIGRTEKPAAYNRRTSTNALVFQYKVAAGDGDDTDGVAVKANSLSLNGGSILDAANKALTLNHDAVPDGGVSHRVDTTGPEVSSLAFRSVGPYSIGDDIEVMVTMNESVTVTGNPRLTLVIGTTDKIMSYVSGSGTTELVFKYKVAAGDGDDADGVSVRANSLTLNGGTMKDDVGNLLTNLNHDEVADAGDSYRVDTTPPKVSSLAFTSTGPYGVGDTIAVTATTSKRVTVSGTPTLTIVIGAANKTANYDASDSGPTSLVFKYTVASGDGDDTDGVSVSANSIALSGGSIGDGPNNALNLNHSGVADAGDSHRVDTIGPSVSSIAFTSTGPYGVGGNIDVTVQTSESVTVTGAPTLTLDIGGADKTASYHSGSGTTSLVFRYTVLSGDGEDTNGVTVKANSLTLNSGTMKDPADNDLTLTHDAKDGGDSHRVDTTGPTVSSLKFTSTGPYGVGGNIDVEVTLSENVTVTGTPQFTLIIDAIEKPMDYHSGSGTKKLVFRYTVAQGDSEDTDGVAVKADSLALNGGTMKDSVGNNLTRTTHTALDGDNSQRVDTALPQVSLIDFSSEGPYKVGSNIEVTVTTSKSVTVTGRPKLTLVIGTTDKMGEYHSGSGTKKLVFRYTLLASDSDDSDGVSVRANPLFLNGGSIVDDTNNALNLTYDAVDGGESHQVDTTPPQINALAFSSTGPYKVGSTIEVTATMSETVTVNTDNGTPSLTLVIGTREKAASYHSGSETDTLVFQYTVATGDGDDANGVSVKADSLNRNSGSILDAATNAVKTTHNGLADGDVSHRVDTTAPVVSSLAFSSTGPYGIGNTIEVTATMNETVTVNTENGTPTLTLMVGTTDRTAAYVSGTGTTGLVFQYTVAEEDSNDTDGVSVKANSLELNEGSILDGAENELSNLNHTGLSDAGDRHKVDRTLTVQPEVNSFALMSRGPYAVGSTIEVQAALNKRVTVSGTPTLTLFIGTTERTARYHSGSGTDALIFKYTVATGDSDDTDGVAVKGASLNFNGGNISDAHGNVLDINHNALANAGTNHRVDATPPTVQFLAFRSQGPYRIGSNIEISVTMSEPVTVNGRPKLTLAMGSTEKTAGYHSGSGTNALVFQYTVGSGDSVGAGGISVRANSLNLNGGGILDTANNAATNLNHDALTDTRSSHQVDTTGPKVLSLAFSSTGPYSVGAVIKVTATLSESVTVTGAPTLTLVIGTTERTAGYVTGTGTSQLAFQYAVSSQDSDDADGISVKANSLNLNGGTITDLTGNAVDLKHSGVVNAGDTQRVGTTVSGIRSVAFSSTGPYTAGDIIKVTVTTTEQVTVTGVPRLALIIGTDTKYADYVSGSGSTSLVFQYTVVKGDEDSDGVEITQNALANHNGSAIQNSYQTALNLSHAGVAADAKHIVDAMPPDITAVDFATDPATTDLEVVLTFEETGVQVTPGANGDVPTVTLLFGSNSMPNSQKTEVEVPYTESRPGSTKLVFTYTVTPDTPVDTDGVQLKPEGLKIPMGGAIRDANGNAIEANPLEDGSSIVAISPSERVNSRPIFPLASSTGVIFNEFRNASRDKHDWVELRNTTGSEVSLGGWKLDLSTERSATYGNVFKFPEMVLPAGAVLLLINTPHKQTELELSNAYSYRYLMAPQLRLPETSFVLLLRNGSGAVADVVGDYYGTAASSDIPIAFENNLAYFREAPDKPGYEAAAWREIGYQAGLGYDRKASKKTSQGTPGYPNSASTSEAASGNSVSISEIMFSTGKTGRLPQWIELYNSSKTDVISLRGWRLQVEGYNPDSAPVRSFITIAIQEMQILPNQTVLFVTKDGRNSKHFPEQRVYNLTKQAPQKLEQTGGDARLMKEKGGFAIVLRDELGEAVDIAGNLDGENGTRDEPNWKLFDCVTRNGNRLSIIRQFEEGKPLTGTQRSSWFRATDIGQKSPTYYGHSGDVGNPGYRKGGPLPVQLSSFKAELTDTGCVITWDTASELENAGFNVLRSETKKGTFKVVNPSLIQGAGTTADRNTYQYTDTSAQQGKDYYYRLEEISFAGVRQTLTTQRSRGNVSPAGRFLTTLGALKKQTP